MLAVSIAISATPALAQTVLNERQISLGLAREAANAAINQCRKDGYQVSVTVVDRSGQVKVMMRDDNSDPIHQIQVVAKLTLPLPSAPAQLNWQIVLLVIRVQPT